MAQPGRHRGINSSGSDSRRRDYYTAPGPAVALASPQTTPQARVSIPRYADSLGGGAPKTGMPGTDSIASGMPGTDLAGIGRTSSDRSAAWTNASSRSEPDRSGSNRSGAGRHRKPGEHRRKSSRSGIPAVPVVAGAATLIAATAGGVALASSPDDVDPHTTTSDRALPAGIALGADQLAETRRAALTRVDRSSRAEEESGSGARSAGTATIDRNSTADERAKWERERAQEAEALSKQSNSETGEIVMERVIEWFSPLSSYRLSASFGQSSYLWSNLHTGQDLSAPMGTPVRAVGNARVIQADWDGPYGRLIKLQHEDGTETWYAHLSGYTVSVGQTVRAGTVIGYVGSTGNSTGPHLHLEVRPGGGDPIDPRAWLAEHGVGL